MTIADEGIGSVYSCRLDLLVYGWEKKLSEKSEDPKFVRCLSLIQRKATHIIEVLKSLRQTVSPADFDLMFENRFQYLDRVSELCYRKGSEEVLKIESLVEDFWPKSPPHSLPPTPQLDSHATPHDSSHHHFGSDLAVGAAARRLHHTVGINQARSFEVAASSATHESYEGNANPVRDRLVSGVAHLSVLEGTALVLPRVPAYLAVTAIHAVEEGAQTMEQGINHFLTTHSPEQFRNDVSPELRAEGVPDLYQLAQASRTVLQVAQLPGQGLHMAHDALADIAGNILDTMGVTDANVGEVVDRLAVVPTVLPPQTFVP